jgi:hypothetical protein
MRTLGTIRPILFCNKTNGASSKFQILQARERGFEKRYNVIRSWISIHYFPPSLSGRNKYFVDEFESHGSTRTNSKVIDREDKSKSNRDEKIKNRKSCTGEVRYGICP